MVDAKEPTAPLLWTEQIVNKDLTASEYFLRQWELQRNVNGSVELTIEEVNDLATALALLQDDVAALRLIDLIAGTGLAGGGDLSGPDRTFNLEDTAVTPGAFTNANITVDQQGRITAAASGSSGASTFDGLTDTPANKTGAGGKFLSVNSGETAIEYITTNTAFNQNYGGVGPGDPDFASVVFLFGWEGADASTPSPEESSFTRTVSYSGNAQADTGQKKFGASSLECDGVGDFTSVPQSTQLSLDDNDFTAETFVRFSSLPGGVNQCFMSNYDATGNNRSWGFIINTSGQLHFLYSTNGTNSFNVVGAWGPSIDTWYHVAVSRVGADLFLFVDGVQVGTTFNISTDFIFDSDAEVTKFGILDIGTNAPLFGWMDETRITIGVGRYNASGFTPPTEAFPRSVSGGGSDVQRHSATLDSLGSLGTAADKMVYTTALETFAETPLTAYIRTLLDDATAGAARTTLDAEQADATILKDVDIDITVQAWDADLDTYSGTPLTVDELSQLQQIGSTTISAAQWVFLGDFNQALTATSNVSFGTGTFSGILKTTDTTESTSASTGAGQIAGGLGIAKSLNVAKFIRAVSSGNITISAGVATVTGSFNSIIAEGGSGADTLVTLNGAAGSGVFLALRGGSGSSITVQHGSSLRLHDSTDFVLADSNHMIYLFSLAAAVWVEIARRDT